MNETTPAVLAEDLLKTFGEQRAVDGIDLDVRRGEVFGVLGPNGAGKTTMLKMLATLLPIDGGHAEIFGHDVRREPHLVRQLLGVTGQYASVDENLTATENLMAVRPPPGRRQGDRPFDRGDPARAVRPHRGRRQADLGLLRRHATAPRPRGQPDHPATADLPRRAHDRARPAHPRPDVGDHPRSGGQRLHRAADDPVPRRGRPARRPDRGDRPRPQGRRGHLGRAEVVDRAVHPAAVAWSTSNGCPRPPRSSSG